MSPVANSDCKFYRAGGTAATISPQQIDNKPGYPHFAAFWDIISGGTRGDPTPVTHPIVMELEFIETVMFMV